MRVGGGTCPFFIYYTFFNLCEPPLAFCLQQENKSRMRKTTESYTAVFADVVVGCLRGWWGGPAGAGATPKQPLDVNDALVQQRHERFIVLQVLRHQRHSRSGGAIRRS